jgi:hypothetical protein
MAHLPNPGSTAVVEESLFPSKPTPTLMPRGGGDAQDMVRIAEGTEPLQPTQRGYGPFRRLLLRYR